MAAAVALADACICDVSELLSLVDITEDLDVVTVDVDDDAADVVVVVVVVVVVMVELSVVLVLVSVLLTLDGDWSRCSRSPRIPLDISM